MEKKKTSADRRAEYGICAGILTAVPFGWLSYIFGVLGLVFGTIAIWKGATRKGIIAIILSLMFLLFFPSFWSGFFSA